MKTYQNELYVSQPGLSENAPAVDENYASIGDPFVMRYNGRYYLYPSPCPDTLGVSESGGIFVWISEDMINWKYGGVVAEGKEINHAYAPEVFYYNGKFLMVTSPRGEGHYLLESDSPLGPFHIIKDNFGLTIDGDLFADDDGQLYFTHAEYPCIYGHTFSPKGDIGPAIHIKGSEMGHWTEGPMILKRGDRYYITMTGNHLLSRGYRVDYAVSDVGPLGPYRILKNKTLLVDTSLDHGSLGHSSTAIGPDLDSYWIFYHNYLIDENGRHTARRTNVDRIVFNGAKMSVAGPTFYSTQAPNAPMFGAWADECPDKFQAWGDGVLSDIAAPESYTAEINLTPGESAVARFGDCEVCFAPSELIIKDSSGNEAARCRMFKGYDPYVLHDLRIEACSEKINLFIDGMRLTKNLPLTGLSGKIGARGARHISYVAFSEYVNQHSDFEHCHPVPGEFDAALFLPLNKGGCSGGHALEECGNRPEDGMRLLLDDEEAWMLLMGQGEFASWRINVKKKAFYHIQIMGRVLSGGTVVFTCGEHSLSKEISCDSEGWIHLGDMEMEAGFGSVSFTTKSGEFCLEQFLMIPSVQPESIELAGLELCHGVRQIEGGGLLHGEGGFIDRWEGLQMDRPIQALGILGNRYLRDSELEADVIFRGDGKEKSAGLFLRLSQDSYYPDQVTVGHRGYYFGFDMEKAFIARMNFDMNILASIPCTLEVERKYTLKARALGGKLQLWLDNQLILSVTEEKPLPYGSVGVGSFGLRVTYTRVKMNAE